MASSHLTAMANEEPTEKPENKQQEEIVALKCELGDIQEQLRRAQTLSNRRDEILDSLMREKNDLVSELKKQDCYNRTLKQQLDDERFFYHKEKEYFCKEMTKQANKKQIKLPPTPSPIVHQQNENPVSSFDQYKGKVEYLKNENDKLEHMLEHRVEVIYKLCIKFLRMKKTKELLMSKFRKLEDEYLKMMADMMTQLDDARNEVNLLIGDRLQEPIHPNNAAFLQVLQRNSRLMYENSELRIEVQKMKRISEKLKDTAVCSTVSAEKFTSHIPIMHPISSDNSILIRNRLANRAIVKQRRYNFPRTVTSSASQCNELPSVHGPCSCKCEQQIQEAPSCQISLHSGLDSSCTSISATRTYSAPEILQHVDLCQTSNQLKSGTCPNVKESSTNT